MACLDDRATYGLGLIEAGVRDYGEWSARLRDDLPNAHFTDGDLNRVWNEARIEYNERLKDNANTVRPKEGPFIDQIAGRYGRPGAAKFIGHLQEPDGTNPLFDKIVDGKPLTPEEQSRAAEAYNLAKDEKAKPNAKPNVEPLRSIMQMAKDIRAEQAKDQNAGKTIDRVPTNAFMTRLRAKVGPDRANGLRSTLKDDGRDTIIDKLARGIDLTDAERLKATRAFDDAAKFTPPTAVERTEAQKAISEMSANARGVASDELAKATTAHSSLLQWASENIPKEKYPDFASDLGKVKPDDYGAMAKVMGKYSKEGVGASYFALWRAGLISNPLIIPKVVLSQFGHLAASELARGAGSLLDRAIGKSTGNTTVLPPSAKAFGQALHAGATTGIEGAKVIAKEGNLGLHARGMTVGSDQADIIPQDFSGNFGLGDKANAGLTKAVQVVGKMHAASYQPGKVAFNDRALSEQSEIQARKEAAQGLIHTSNIADRTDQLKNNPTNEMKQEAGNQAEQGTFLNKNSASAALGAAKATSPAANAVLSWAAPISKVPFNIIWKSLGDYTAGVPVSLGQLAINKARSAEMPPELQNAISMRFGRGTVGATLLAAGYLAKDMFPHAVIAPKQKSYDKGGVKVGHFNLATGNIDPTATPLEAGVLLHNALNGTDAEKKSAMADGAFAMFGDIPGAQVSNSIAEAYGSPDALKKFAALQASSAVPGAVKALANYTDKDTLGGEHYRKVEKGHPLEYIEKGIPGLREKVPLASE